MKQSKRAVAFLNKMILAARGGGSVQRTRFLKQQPQQSGLAVALRSKELRPPSLDGAGDNVDYGTPDNPYREVNGGDSVANIVALPRV